MGSSSLSSAPSRFPRKSRPASPVSALPFRPVVPERVRQQSPDQADQKRRADPEGQQTRHRGKGRKDAQPFIDDHIAVTNRRVGREREIEAGCKIVEAGQHSRLRR